MKNRQKMPSPFTVMKRFTTVSSDHAKSSIALLCSITALTIMFLNQPLAHARTCLVPLNTTKLSVEEKCRQVLGSYGAAVQKINRSESGQILSADLRTGVNLKCSEGTNFDLTQDSQYSMALDHVDMSDILAQSYPAGYSAPIRTRNHSPGRLRNDALLAAMYVHSKMHEARVNGLLRKSKLSPSDYKDLSEYIRANITAVDFLGFKIPMNRNNGAAQALKNLGEFLTKHHPDLAIWLKTNRSMSGGFNIRPISGTNRFSSHSWGIAIDFTPKKDLAKVKWFDAYWKWVAACAPELGCPEVRTNAGAKFRMDLPETKLSVWIHPENFDHFPPKLVKIFEEFGFIWGGKWHHFDTMHFEYRPEFFVKSTCSVT